MKKNIYIISGLGADERVFQKIDFQDYSPIFIQWISPKRKEDISHYAKRLMKQIHDEKPVLMGLSFGGMMAIEISKHIETEKIILLSSAKTKHELPSYFRWIGALRIHKLVPISFLKKPNSFSNWIFGASSTLEKSLLKIILKETESNYLKWSIHTILTWENEFIPTNIAHIHGTKDHILPIRFTKCDVKIQDGGHFMLLNKHEELNQLLKNLL